MKCQVSTRDCISCGSLSLSVNICILRGPSRAPMAPEPLLGNHLEMPPSCIQMSDYLSLCGFFFFFLNWERRIRQKYILQVRGLRPFTLEFLVGRVSESLEPAACGFEVLLGLGAAGPLPAGCLGLWDGSLGSWALSSAWRFCCGFTPFSGSWRCWPMLSFMELFF